MAYKLNLATTERGYPTGPGLKRLFGFYTYTYGLSLSITGTVGTEVEEYEQVDADAADFFFIGGNEYNDLTTAEYDAVVAAGYASYVEVI